MIFPNNYTFIKLLLLLLLFNACKSTKTKNSEEIVPIITSEEELIIDDNFNLQNFKQIKYEIISHQLIGVDLNLKVKTENLCGEQHFALYTTSALMKSLPPQKSLYLVCEKCNHECDKSATIDLNFKLNALKNVPYETIVLNLDHYDAQIIYKNKHKIKQ